MKSYSSREIIKLLKEDGWYEVNVTVDHYQFKHPTKPNKVTVPHPKKSYPVKTQISILKQAGIEI